MPTIKATEAVSTDTMNEAIAMFMGATIDEHGRLRGLSKRGYYRVSSLSYDSSWDSLMPVFNKIKSLGRYSFEMGAMKNMDYYFVAIVDAKRHKQLIYLHSMDSLITIAHQAVYKFITEHHK